MKNSFVLFSTALFATSLFSVAHAATPPSGSYKGSCAVQSFTSSVLTAACRPESNPNFRTTQIDVRGCRANPDVFNRDGGLQCYAGQGWGSGRAIPRGSYIDSCKDVIVSDDRKKVVAQCKDSGGNYQKTEIPTSSCQAGNGLDNQNGKLACHR